MRDGSAGCCGHHRLGVIGDAQAGFLNHRQVSGAVAHSHGFACGQAEFFAQFDQRGELGLAAENRLLHRACEGIAVLNEAVGAVGLDAAGLGHPRVRAAAPYDLVFANILAPPLVALSQDIKLALKPGGIAILSGLLRTQERRVFAAYASKGFRLERRLHRDAWATLVLRRS